MKKVIMAAFMLFAALNLKAQQLKDSSFYIRKIQPVVIGLDTFNVLAVSSNPQINLNKNTLTVSYVITKQGSQNKIVNRVTVPFNANKETLIKIVAIELKLKLN